jgi:dephospho-CoA kinase
VVIGLTGNIATGKSKVLEMLAQLGAFTVDADQLVHQILDHDPAAQVYIRTRFGPGTITAHGMVDRALLASIVFRDPAALQDLEAMIHPRVGALINQLISELKAPVVAVEAIKLLESPLRALCHQVWVTTCPEEQQFERMVSGRGMTRAQAVERIRSQPRQRDKIAQADVVIDTSKRLEDTQQQVRDAWQRLCEQPGPGMPVGEITIRRAGPRDLEALEGLLAQTDSAPRPDPGHADRSRLLENLGQQGYLLAESHGRIRGAIAWNAENLVAHGHRVMLVPYDEQVGQTLLEAFCQAAQDLMCEVAFLYAPTVAHDPAACLYRSCGFELTDPAALRGIWRDAAQAAMPPGTRLLMRTLRDRPVGQPA